MKLIYKFLEISIAVVGFVLVFFSVVIASSLQYIPQKNYQEVLTHGKYLLVSEILLFLIYNYLHENPNPMKTLINFFNKVKSLDFYAPIFMLLTFISIYYTFGFMELYQDKDLGLFFGLIYYFGVFLGFTSITSFTYLTYKYANDTEDSELSESPDNDTSLGADAPSHS